MRLFVSESHDICENLAFEESLLRLDGESAFLWVNDPCVVIGRNQNPYQEVDLAVLESQGIALARRLSGGGAVYQDRGNLNYSVVCDEQNADGAARWAVDALATLGVFASISGRNDIVVGGVKAGGLAERFDGRLIQHGTIMVDVDLVVLEQALRPSPMKLAKHSIRSVRSRVANLTQAAPGLTTERVLEAFVCSSHANAEQAAMTESIHSRAQELRDPAWVFADYQSGEADLELEIGGDLYGFALVFEGCEVASAVVSTDSIHPVGTDVLKNRLARTLPCKPDAAVRYC